MPFQHIPRKITLSDAEKNILKNFAKSYPMIRKLKADGKTPAKEWKQFRGHELINNPQLAGKKNWVPNKVYSIPVAAFHRPDEFFIRFVESAGLNDPTTLQKAVDSWMERHKKVSMILANYDKAQQEQAYDLANRRYNRNDQANNAPPI